MSSVQNSLQKVSRLECAIAYIRQRVLITVAFWQHNKGAMGVFTRTGGTIGMFGEASAGQTAEPAQRL